MHTEVYALMLDDKAIMGQGQGQKIAILLYTNREIAEHANRVFRLQGETEVETVQTIERLFELIDDAESREAVEVAWNLVPPTRSAPPVCEGWEPLNNLRHRMMPKDLN